jgi:hypothetical protein
MKQNSKVLKSAKTKLSDLTPKKDTRGGGVVPLRTPPAYYPPSDRKPSASLVRKLSTV